MYTLDMYTLARCDVHTTYIGMIGIPTEGMYTLAMYTLATYVCSSFRANHKRSRIARMYNNSCFFRSYDYLNPTGVMKSDTQFTSLVRPPAYSRPYSARLLEVC